jgi:hypothetical protein
VAVAVMVNVTCVSVEKLQGCCCSTCVCCQTLRYLHLIMAHHGLSPCILQLSSLRTVLPEEARQDKMLLLCQWLIPGAVSAFCCYCYAPFTPYYTLSFVAEVCMKNALGTGSGWVLTSEYLPPLVHLGM